MLQKAPTCVTVEAGELAKAIANFRHVIERRTTIPVLQKVLLRWKSGSDRLDVDGTNLVAWINTCLPAYGSGQANLNVCVNHAQLASLVDALEPDAEIEMTYTDQKLAIKAGDTLVTMEAISGDDFPTVKIEGETASFTLPPADLLRSIDDLSPSIGREPTRYYLNGIYIEFGFGKSVQGKDRKDLSVVSMTSTDGHRLASVDMTAAIHGEGGAAIFPNSAIKALRSMLGGVDDVTVKVHSGSGRSGRMFEVASGATVLTVKAVDGTYPDYHRVVPMRDSRSTKAQIEASKMVRTLRILSAAIDRNCKSVLINFESNQTRLTVNNDTHGAIKITSVCPALITGGAKGKKAEPAVTQIGFQAKYLEPIVKSAGKGNFTLDVEETSYPCLIRFSERPDLLMILMPMRI